MIEFRIIVVLLLSSGFVYRVWYILPDQYAEVLDFQPQQVHISYGDSLSEIIVTWATVNKTDNSIVEYGIGSLTKKATGTSTLFVDGGEEKRSQYVHRVRLTGLKPQKKYLYQCGSGKGWSDVFWFHTYRNDSEGPLRFAIYGDLGNVNAVSLPHLQREVQRNLYDAVFHIGDFAYNMESENGRVGDAFMRQLEPVAAYVPYMTCVGNHEKAYNFSHYKEKFSMPMSQYENLWYSFNMGPVHFVAINTEAYNYMYILGENVTIKQFEWLAADLKEANLPKNRALHPWIILYGHRPMYCSDRDPECVLNELPTRSGLPITHLYAMEPLLYKYGVDLAFWGHEHSYERLWPVYNFTVKNGSRSAPYTNPKATVHIVTGSAGSDELLSYFIHKPKAYSAFRADHYGYARVKVFNSTHLRVQEISVNQKHQILDEMWLIQHTHGSFSNK